MRTMRRSAWSAVSWSTVVLILAGCQGPEVRPAEDQWRQAETPGGKPSLLAPVSERDVLPRTHYAAGRLHESQNQLNRAVEQYEAAVRLDPRFVDAHNGLGVCLTRLGKYLQAEEHFVKAIELAPDQPHLRNNLAFLYISQRRWADAEAELRNALQLKGDFVRARINLGLALAQQSKFDGALEAFRAVLNEADAQFNMGLMYQSLDRYADAGKAFETAIEKNPRFVAAKERLEKLQPFLERLGRAEQAREREAAASTTQPAGTLASIEQATVAPAVAKRAGDVAGEQDVAAGHAEQASPSPRALSEILPEAQHMVAAVSRAVRRLAAARVIKYFAAPRSIVVPEASNGFMVTCEARVTCSPPEDLDLQDDVWLMQTDPGQASLEAWHVGALEEGTEVRRGRWPVVSNGKTRSADEAMSGLLPYPGPGDSFLIGATLLPDDPFLVFPRR